MPWKHLSYINLILPWSCDSVALVVENLQLYNKIAARLKGNNVIKFVIVLWASKDNLEDSKVQADYPIYSFEELVASGKNCRQALAAVANSGSYLYTLCLCRSSEQCTSEMWFHLLRHYFDLKLPILSVSAWRVFDGDVTKNRLRGKDIFVRESMY